MNVRNLIQTVVLSVGIALGAPAFAIVIGFEDVVGTNNLADGYQGFEWDSNVGDINVVNGASYNSSGYQVLADATGSEIVAYNSVGINPTDIIRHDGGTFDLASAWFASAWDATLEMTFEGLLNGSVIYSVSQTVTNTTATNIIFNWSGIDTFRINDTGSQFAMDNLVVNESLLQVPSPATVYLFALGLLVLRLRAKKSFL